MDWFRSWHGAPTNPKWGMIGRKVGLPAGMVFAVVWSLFDRASQAKERGSIAGYDAEEIAYVQGCEADQVEAVIAEMTARGMIDGDVVTAWTKHQPAREDGSAERAKAWRERMKEERERDRTQANAGERTETKSNAPDTDTDKNITTHQRAGARETDLSDRLLEAGGEAIANPASSPSILSLADVHRWIEGGCDIDRDILDTIRSRAVSRPSGSVRTWRFFEAAVLEARDRRLNGVPPPTPRAGAPPRKPTFTPEQIERMEAEIAERKAKYG